MNEPEGAGEPTTHRAGPQGQRWTPLLQSLLGASAVFAGALYAGYHLALVTFYRPFGLTPEDVGWDLQKTLAAFAVLLLISIFVIVAVIGSQLRALRGRPGRLRTFYMALGALAVVSYVFAIPAWLAHNRADRVWNNDFIPSRFDAVSFPVNTPCVHASWKNPEDIKIESEEISSAIGSEHDLVLLGNGGALTFLFEPESHTTLRIATSDVVLTSC